MVIGIIETMICVVFVAFVVFGTFASYYFRGDNWNDDWNDDR